MLSSEIRKTFHYIKVLVLIVFGLKRKVACLYKKKKKREKEGAVGMGWQMLSDVYFLQSSAYTCDFRRLNNSWGKIISITAGVTWELSVG